MERLDKFISSRTAFSRKEVQKLIRSGQVEVNGEVCKTVDYKIDPESDSVKSGGQAVSADEHIYIMLNKPAGVVSATEDKRDKTVIDILPPELKRAGLFPAGRLDKDTEGLLIITDDGDFAHRILSPKKHVEKQYVAQLDGEITDEVIERFEQGIVLSDGTQCMPAKLKISSERGKKSGTVTICEGKYHQVKRMFAACGLKVVHLERISVGNLYLDGNLPRGSAKKLSKYDIDAIFIGKIH